MEPNLISDIHLRWYDETSLLTEKPKKLIKLFLESVGIRSDAAARIFEVLVKYNAKGVAPTSKEMINEILKDEEDKNEKATVRITQIWLKYFREIKLIDKIGGKNGRYVFSGNKKPSEAFMLYTKPLIIDESVNYSEKILKKMEEKYKKQVSV